MEYNTNSLMNILQRVLKVKSADTLNVLLEWSQKSRGATAKIGLGAIIGAGKIFVLDQKNPNWEQVTGNRYLHLGATNTQFGAV